ncbi:EAL domain-containing protein [Murimonas intestini]|uniref:Diguanylate cyclase (GGDEF)-like protein n=1 Tax=Murimonas intestini TaxID=1337051 RepID=A0AB73T3D1_9FIRM|nr:EAL domain-containing protein [Murimonas intestini]MCR1841708.1 EAL domain-containing protein [Murimonas intestini]MCR1865525.1 EAL domain-containing protein [Murimonas intestini]MCR1883894.1 EAL domain-containing protein [Murimonas intestini]
MWDDRVCRGIDPLTKLWTEDAAKELIEDYSRDGKEYEGDVLYMIYLEGWENFKERASLETGNSVLRQVAFLLEKLYRRPDVTARAGENAFIVYELGCRSVKEASERAEELCAGLRRIRFFEDEKNGVNIRTGAVWCRGEIREYSTLVRAAGYAVKCAAEKGEYVKAIAESSFLEEPDAGSVEIGRIAPYDVFGGETDIEFITELTDMLFLCEDAAVGIEMSMERLCLYFQADRACVMELSTDRKYFETAYEYHTNNLRVKNDNLFRIPTFFVKAFSRNFDERGLYVCNSLTELEKENRVIAEREKVYGTKALMQSSVLEQGEFRGYISICDMKEERLWTKREITTFLMAGKLIAASILRVRSLEYSQHVTYRDLLTESWNKNKFIMEAAKKPRKQGMKRAVVTFDLKNFKVINQEFGYDMGNAVLIEISNLLGMFIEKDECYARIEADTFVLLFYYRETSELEARVGRLLNHVERLSARLGLVFSFICMAGICAEEDGSMEIQEMIECADMVRKSIKDYHKSSSSFFNREMQQRRDREKYIASRMKKALESGEFLVYYQPRVDIRTGEYISLEALARWQPPGEALIMPGEFIPLFEQNGFISELDMYVFEQVCREIQGWMRSGRKVYPVAVNLSRIHIREKHFLEHLESVCRKYGVPVDYIELELTESAFLDDPEVIMESAVKIKEKGFVLSMDDFGTGFSSLSMLKDIPVDIIKLDQSFFQKKMTEREKIIISYVIQMTRELQIEVVSEGIETEEHEQFLKEIGCDIAQGYLYARPAPLAVHEAKLWK